MGRVQLAFHPGERRFPSIPEVRHRHFTAGLHGRWMGLLDHLSQQDFSSPILGTLNVEVTVTGQRGWVNEPGQTVYADMGVKGRIWISESSKSLHIVRDVMKKFDTKKFPFSKANSVNVTTHNPGQPWNPIFSLYNGTDTSFPQPLTAQHWHEAYGVGYLNVEIGAIEKTGIDNVDKIQPICAGCFQHRFG
jgi:hypothetical protein